MTESHFWAGGQEEAIRVRRKEFRSRVSVLEQRAASAEDPAERDRLLGEIAAAREELAREEKGLRWSLYGAI